jgi:hypothetical protein
MELNKNNKELITVKLIMMAKKLWSKGYSDKIIRIARAMKFIK